MASRTELEKAIEDCNKQLDAKKADSKGRSGPAIVGIERNELKLKRASLQIELDAKEAKK